MNKEQFIMSCLMVAGSYPSLKSESWASIGTIMAHTLMIISL